MTKTKKIEILFSATDTGAGISLELNVTGALENNLDLKELTEAIKDGRGYSLNDVNNMPDLVALFKLLHMIMPGLVRDDRPASPARELC